MAGEAQKWADFYLVAGPSAAVLIGLLFVALSINRTVVEAHAHLGGQARQAIYALGSILVISLLVLIPDQSTTALGIELILGALLNLLLAVRRQARRLRRTPIAMRRSSELLMAIFDGALLLIIAGGVVLVAGSDSGFKVLVPAVIALALLAIANSWSLTLVGEDP